MSNIIYASDNKHADRIEEDGKKHDYIFVWNDLALVIDILKGEITNNLNADWEQGNKSET